MENFAAAILSNPASDTPADRLRWLHTINLLVTNTSGALHAGTCGCEAGGRGTGSTAASAVPRHPGTAMGDFYRQGLQKLIGLKILISATPLIWRCLAPSSDGTAVQKYKQQKCKQHFERGHGEKINKQADTIISNSGISTTSC